MAQNDILAKVSVIINAQTAALGKDLKGAQSQISSFTNGVTKLAGTLGVAFGIQQVSSFALEVSKLAGEAKGVKEAFDRLPGSVKVLQDLKAATGGTVSELELMKRAVQATNFGLELGSLPELFRFATLRAQQTGQAVDYLTDSIVTGIGRKSLLILDNLGISATAIREKLNGAALASVDVATATRIIGEIAKEALGDMADFSENASTKLQRLNASWENYKVSVGEAANSTGILGTAIDATTGALDILSSKDISFFQKLAAFVGVNTGGAFAAQMEIIIAQAKRIQEEQKEQENIVKRVDIAYKEFNGDLEAYKKILDSVSNQFTTQLYKEKLLAEFKKRTSKALEEEEKQLETIANLTARNTELLEEQAVTIAGPVLKSINNEIKANEAKIKVLKELGTVQGLSRASTSTKPLQTEVTPFKDTGDPFAVDIDLDKLDAAIVKLTELETTYYKSGQAFKDWGTAGRIAHAEQQEAAFRTAQAAAQMGDIIGNAFGNVISGQEDMKTAIIRATTEILKQFLARAIGGMISSAATSGAPPPIAIALAAAGAGAISAMFSKLTGKARGGSSGGSSISSSATRSSSNFSTTSGQNSQLIPSFKIQGQDLWVIFNAYQTNNKYTSAIGG